MKIILVVLTMFLQQGLLSQVKTIQPIFSIEGFIDDSIPISVLKKATSFTIAPSYLLQSLVVTHTNAAAFSEPIALSQTKNKFDWMLLTVLSKAQVGSRILITNLKIVDAKGEPVTLKNRFFKVVNDF